MQVTGMPCGLPDITLQRHAWLSALRGAQCGVPPLRSEGHDKARQERWYEADVSTCHHALHVMLSQDARYTQECETSGSPGAPEGIAQASAGNADVKSEPKLKRL